MNPIKTRNGRNCPFGLLTIVHSAEDSSQLPVCMIPIAGTAGKTCNNITPIIRMPPGAENAATRCNRVGVTMSLIATSRDIPAARAVTEVYVAQPTVQ